ncbi:MAG: HEPN domain-containing protein [Candidatus Hydrogenedentes bacterium]|nr:HEPN domain-containing protein [Candidatus Hydrogenedentota bacterium]
MSIDERIAEKFKALLAEGKAILQRSGWNGQKYQSSIDDVAYIRFRTEELNLIKRSCGEDSDHYQQLKTLAEDKNTALNSYYFKDCYGVLEAASRDYEGGMIFQVRAMVAAEVLDDFLEQAEHLLEQGFHVPAASLAGAVLEDTLRKLSEAKGISVPDKTSIDKLNAELAKAGVYDKLVLKRITAIADVRNNADHGNFDKFEKEDVEDMLKWVRRFSADFLG